MQQLSIQFVVALATVLIAFFLQGCGDDKPTPAPSPGPRPPTPAPTPSSGWKLNPIEVRGQHLFDSVTGESFFARGMCLPNVGNNVSEWIKVLRRVHDLSPRINVVRLYTPPTCAEKSDCFAPFMQEADKLGIYVLVPGTGTTWGWLPSVGTCHTSNECYFKGGVLGWGQTMVRFFNYPNTLAIVIGNEFDQQMPEYMPVIKAYARDLKSHMEMCDTNSDSASYGKMRRIPLMYASSDDRGDAMVKPKADYLFCKNTSESIDIFGLNVERWCDVTQGRHQYQAIDQWVEAGKYPGAFMFSEMGCTKSAYPNQTRDWAQVHAFFDDMKSVDGYTAYTYSGNPNFDMFDADTSDANLFQDGRNFFDQVNKDPSKGVPHKSVDANTPPCATTMNGHKMDSVDSVQHYDTGAAGWASGCPKPPAPYDVSVANVASITV